MFRFRTAVLFGLLFLSGCGYTTQHLLPSHIKNIHIAPVKNSIDITREISRRNPTEGYQVYRPGIEVDITNGIINRFIFDGNLKVTGPEKADAVVEASIKEYRRDVLRYSDSDDVEEFRVSIVLKIKVTDTVSQKILWLDEAMTGDTTFFVAGSRTTSEEQAIARAVEDISRRVVERTIEIW